MTATLRKGTQVACIPDHAKEMGGLAHPDTQFGFIMSKHPTQDAYYVRYWAPDLLHLRTTSVSELTNVSNLVTYQSVPYTQVNEAIEGIERKRL